MKAKEEKKEGDEEENQHEEEDQEEENESSDDESNVVEFYSPLKKEGQDLFETFKNLGAHLKKPMIFYSDVEGKLYV